MKLYLTTFTTVVSIIIITTIIVIKIYVSMVYIIRGNYVLMLNILTIPITFSFLLFPVNFLVTNLVIPFLTRRYLLNNSLYYSNNLRYPDVDYERSITINVPIYDEDFKKVIRPMLRSCILARDLYNLNRSGSCNIVVNDDGIMKFIGDNLDNIYNYEEVNNRISYYIKHNIGFTARGTRNRKGRFKKASNINSWLNYIYKNDIQNFDELNTDDTSLIKYGNLSLGDYFILIDSDSIIPPDFLSSNICEFENEKHLGYTQNFTIPLESSYQNYFSRMISHFTINLYNVVFRLSTRNGDICPLIGHNITIRTEIFEKIINKSDDYIQFWAEDRVSEDFDICLKLNELGYFGRYICYENCLFKEGVSLSYKDEMSKYSKFAYGASEMLFNPFSSWIKQGIFSKSIKRFLSSKKVIWTSRINVYGYIISYFCLASSIISIPLILICYCYFELWTIVFFDVFYNFLFLTVLFGFITPISTYIVKKKINNKHINNSLLNEFLSGGFFFIFYSSISFPIFIGIISHLFNINIQWGSTIKVLENDTRLNVFFKIIREEKFQLIFMMFNIFLIIFFIFYIRCFNIYVIISLSTITIGHIITPFILNPNLFNINKYKFEVEESN